MAKWSVTYNGFGSEGAAQYTWSHVNITSQSMEPVFSSDGISIETNRHTIVGTALISENTEANFRTALLRARDRLSRQPKGNTAANAVKIYLDLSDGTGTNEMTSGLNSTVGDAGLDAKFDATAHGAYGQTVYYYGFQEDDYGSPSIKYSINEVYGTLTALVSFTITWNKVEPPTDSVAYTVLSHTWTQEYTIDESGSTTLVVDGELRVRNWVDNKQATTGKNRGTNPDRYRTLVMPAVPVNYRVESMRWATDKTGNVLIYRITLKEHARPLPFPAKTGRGRFTYQRSMADLNGIKTFEGELEGDAGSDPRELLNSLIRVAASRIRFGGGSSGAGVPGPGGSESGPGDIIQSITVGENDIFSRKAISLRITARGFQSTSPFGVQNDPNGDQGPGFDLLSPFFKEGELTVSERPNEYGTSLIQSVKRQMFFPWNPDESTAWVENSDFPVALWRRGDEWSGEDVALAFEDELFESEAALVETGGEGEHAHDDIEITGQVNNPYALVSGTESITVKSNVVVMSGQSLSSADALYQTAKPIVLVESEYRVSRLGVPPKRFMLNKPENGVILEETFDINRGDVDANNNRTYIGVYRRIVRLIDLAGGLEDGFYGSTFTLPGWGDVTLMYWWPPVGKLASPADPRFEGRDNEVGETIRTIFEIDDLPGQGTGQPYELGSRPSIFGRDETEDEP